MSRIRTNQITNQSADGAPTVQNGLVISGVTTSTTFSGSGASLTNLPSAQLTGALPALDGSNLTGLSGVSVANQADNRLITATGTTDALNGEANLTWDGSNLTSTISGNSGIVVAASGNNAPQIRGTANRSAQNNTLLSLHGEWNGNAVTMIDLQAGPDTSNKDDGQIGFYTRKSGSGSMSQRLHINSLGGVGIGTNNFSSQLNNEVGLAIHGSSNDNCRISITTPTKSNSRIGYFGLSNRFGIDVHYGFEIRDAEDSYATRFKIDNNGYMTNNQPYAYFRFNAHNDTGSMGKMTSVYTATVQNGMAHDGSGRFTVPVSGKYLIGSDNNILDNSDHYTALYINGSNKDGFRYQNTATNSSNANVWKSSSRTCILILNANDYIEIYARGAQDNEKWNQHFIYLIG